MTQTCHEISSAEELQATVGSQIISVTEANGDEGICFNCKDTAGKLIGFLITEEGSWHLCKGEENEKIPADIKKVGRKEKALEYQANQMNKETATIEMVARATKERTEFVKKIADAKLTLIEFIRQQGWTLQESDAILAATGEEFQSAFFLSRK